MIAVDVLFGAANASARSASLRSKEPNETLSFELSHDNSVPRPGDLGRSSPAAGEALPDTPEHGLTVLTSAVLQAEDLVDESRARRLGRLDLDGCGVGILSPCRTPGAVHDVWMVRRVTGCSFCDLEGFRANSTMIRETDLCVFANNDAGEGADGALLRGAGIIVPKAHKPTVFDLSPEEMAATFELLLVARELMDDRYRPDGYTIGWNCYAASGQTVAHAHLHVLPRFLDEPHSGKGVRWFLRQDDNHRPNPLAPGHGTRTIHTSST